MARKKVVSRFFNKQLSTRASLVVLVLVFCMGLVLGGAFISPTGLVTESTYTASSVITDVRLGPTYGFFQVPDGKAAYDVAGYASKATGWGIYKATVKDGRPSLVSYDPVYHTSFGLNRRLQLNKGSYILMVDGSQGASAVIEYKLR